MKLKDVIVLSEYDDIRNMPNISYIGKVPSQVAIQSEAKHTEILTILSITQSI